MYDIGVIGDYDSICGFSAVGFHIFPVESVEQAREELQKAVKNDYGIIYITEPYMEKLWEDCVRYNEQVTPCIIPISSSTGVTGFGESLLSDYVKKAVGSDIIFSD